MKGLVFMVALLAVAHGQRAESLTRILNAPVPDWLSLAEPIKVESIEGGGKELDQSQFRSPSGGVMHGTHHIEIPKLDLVVELDEERSLSHSTINKSTSRSYVSLSPDESKLVINGRNVHLYELREDGQVTEITAQVPSVTYDKGPKGFIWSWFWASDDVLLGYGSIEDEKGYDVLENRLYAFDTRTSSLARLDLSAFDTKNVLDVVSVGKDLSELVLNVDGVNNVRVKADLKSPHKLIPASSQETLGQTATPGRSPIFSPSLAGRHTPPVREPFPWLWLLAIVGVMLGVFSYLYRSSRPR